MVREWSWTLDPLAQQIFLHGLMVFKVVGHRTKGESLDSSKRCGFGLTIRHNAWQGRHFTDPPASASCSNSILSCAMLTMKTSERYD